MNEKREIIENLKNQAKQLENVKGNYNEYRKLAYKQSGMTRMLNHLKEEWFFSREKNVKEKVQKLQKERQEVINEKESIRDKLDNKIRVTYDDYTIRVKNKNLEQKADRIKRLAESKILNDLYRKATRPHSQSEINSAYGMAKKLLHVSKNPKLIEKIKDVRDKLEKKISDRLKPTPGEEDDEDKEYPMIIQSSSTSYSGVNITLF